jgi:hypothetical protein
VIGDAERTLMASVAAAVCEDAHAVSHELADRWDIAVEMSLRTPSAGGGR